MVFKVIDGQLTSIFNKTKKVSDGFNLATKDLNRYVDAFQRINSKQSFGGRWRSFLEGMNKLDPNLGVYFEDLAKQGASAQASIQGMYSAILDGNTRGIGNVKSIISTFNTLDPTRQKAFASAVGKTNAKLGAYLTGLDGANASFKGYGTQLGITTAKTIGLQIASTALNAVITMGLSLGISALVSGLSHWINAQQETIDKAKESADTLQDEIDTIDDYIAKTKELRKKLDEGNLSLEESKNIRSELRDIQTELVDKYGEEAKGIDLVTGSIEEQTQALYELQKAKYEDTYQLNKEGYDAAQKQIQSNNLLVDADRVLAAGYGASYSKDVNAFREFVKREFSQRGYNFGHTINSSGHKRINRIYKTSDMYTLDEDLSYIYKQVEEYSKNGSQEVKDAADTTLTYLSQIRRDWSNKTITENEELYSQWLKHDSDYSDDYIDLVRKQANLEDTIESGNAEDIATSKAEFAELYQNIIDKAIANGDTDVAKYLEKVFGDVTDSLEETANVIDNKYVPAVKSLVDEYENLSEAIDGVISKQSKLIDIYKRIMSGETFSAEDIVGFIKDFPSLANYLQNNGNGEFTFSISGLELEMNSVNNTLESDIQKLIDDATKGVTINIDDFFNNSSDYQSALNKAKSGFRSQADADKFKENYKSTHLSEYNNYVSEQTELSKKWSAILSLVDDDLISQAEHLQLLNEYYQNSVEKITAFNSSLDDIQDAIDTVNAGQGLSYEQMGKILAIDPSIKMSIDSQTGLYYVEIQALNDLKKARGEEQDKQIDCEKKKTKELLEQAKIRVNTLKGEISILYAKNIAYINMYGGLSEEANKSRENLESELSQTLSDIEKYQGMIDSFDNYKYASINNSNTSGSSVINDILQQQIEYYELLLNAIEIVANKRIELLEAEKEALQDKNDEEQRELDLIEAKNNLDKAKKMKTIVYEKGKGFIQVENKKAISEAQKEYDNAVLEMKTAEIDKQIKAIEDYAKSFTEMRSDIEDAITVEQAKKALKTDENGLLNLDEKTAKNIRDGLAEAVLKKDKQDNSGNPYYQPVTMDDLLKKLGATVTSEQAKAIFAESLRTTPLPNTNMQAFNNNTTNNSYVNNASSSSNRNITINPVFNIYDASDPVKIRNEIDGYFRDIAREIK